MKKKKKEVMIQKSAKMIKEVKKTAHKEEIFYGRELKEEDDG